MSELDIILVRLKAAKAPEDVFGALAGSVVQQLAACKRIYRRLALATHEDRNPNALGTAHEAFHLVSSFWEQAKSKIHSGTYGNRAVKAASHSNGPLVIRTRRRIYSVAESVATGVVADIFRATAIEGGKENHVFLKIARTSGDNGFLENEARVLKHLRGDKRSEPFHGCFPEVVDSYRITDPGSKSVLQVVATAPYSGHATLEEIVRAYPGGVDPRDMAWMWKRILALASIAHVNGVIHGGLVPPCVGLDLAKHGPFFADWPFAVMAADQQRVEAIVPGYEAYYPPEIMRKEVPTSATDIYMVGKCMIRLLGGNVETGELPPTVPSAIRRLLRASTIPEASRRLDDAWRLHQEFDGLLEGMFGPRKFRKFAMPRS